MQYLREPVPCILAGKIGKLTTKVDVGDPQSNGDWRGNLTLTGPDDGSDSPLGKTKIAGDLGSGDGNNPITWDLTGDPAKIDASKGIIEGFDLIVHSDVPGLKLGHVRQANITVGDAGDRGTINKLDFSQWDLGTITAGAINKFTGKPKVAGTNGDFTGTVRIEGTPGATADTIILKKVTLNGRLLNALIEVLAGSVGKAKFGTMENSQLRVGVRDTVARTDLPANAGDFLPNAGSVNKLTVKGLKGVPKTNPSFINSMVAAFTIGKASFKVVQTDNTANTPHGLGATLITKLSGTKEDGTKFPKLKNLDVQQDVIDQLEGFDLRDFRLTVV